MGMGIGSIPVTAIIDYGQFHDCDHDLMLDLIEYVMMLDQIYIKRENKKAKAKK